MAVTLISLAFSKYIEMSFILIYAKVPLETEQGFLYTPFAAEYRKSNSRHLVDTC